MLIVPTQLNLFRACLLTGETGEIAIEAFTCMMIFKNIFCFGLTFSAEQWILSVSAENVFLIIAGIQVFVCLLGIPMCKFSFQIHYWWHQLILGRYLWEAESKFLPSTRYFNSVPSEMIWSIQLNANRYLMNIQFNM
jgi:hypothetical protein